MRIEAPRPEPWLVWHAELCRAMKDVIWVDDELAQWCEAAKPLRVALGGGIVTQVHQAKRIVIIQASALIVIDPIADEEPASNEVQLSALVPTP